MRGAAARWSAEIQGTMRLTEFREEFNGRILYPGGLP